MGSCNLFLFKLGRKITSQVKCVAPENGISGGWGGLQSKKPSVGEVWIFAETAH